MASNRTCIASGRVGVPRLLGKERRKRLPRRHLCEDAAPGRDARGSRTIHCGSALPFRGVLGRHLGDRSWGSCRAGGAVARSGCAGPRAPARHSGERAPLRAWSLTREGQMKSKRGSSRSDHHRGDSRVTRRPAASSSASPAGNSGPGQAGDSACTSRACSPFREGALLEAAVRALPELPDLLLVDATGRDHPRAEPASRSSSERCSSSQPSASRTRSLVAQGEWPADERAARTPLLLGGEPVGNWLRTRAEHTPAGRPAAWRTDPDTAAEVVLSAPRVRTRPSRCGGAPAGPRGTRAGKRR